jgi:catechol 2,3-dioxygenase-like lactoylglutathione lyase family enzyme
MVTCSCCGELRSDSQVGSLNCHPDVRVCRDCINWLQHQAGMVESTPTFPVVDMPATVKFYKAAGFDVHAYNDGFAFVKYENVSVFDLGVNPTIDPKRNGAGCFLIVPNVDAWHSRMTAKDVPVTSIQDMPWGMREFTLTDPNGNRIRIGSTIAST